MLRQGQHVGVWRDRQGRAGRQAARVGRRETGGRAGRQAGWEGGRQAGRQGGREGDRRAGREAGTQESSEIDKSHSQGTMALGHCAQDPGIPL